MRTNILLMCKLMFLLMLINGYWAYLSDPFLPFIPALDAFREYPGYFGGSLKALFLSAGIALLFNFRVRTMALILGSIVILSLLGSKPVFRNHLFICGCAFLLAGLSSKDRDPWLLYVQLSLVYIGAVLNKVGEPDWWDGQFMHNWLLNARENGFYRVMNQLLPERVFATFLSWSSMGIETCIAVMLLFKKRHNAAVWTILVFHTALFTMTGFRFGHFFEDILVYLLVFRSWPEKEIEIEFNQERTFLNPNLLSFANWNRQFVLKGKTEDPAHWLSVRYDHQIHVNYRALGKVLLSTPATYFALLFLDTAVRYLFNPAGEHLVTALWLWAGILFFFALGFRSPGRSQWPGNGKEPSPVI